MRTSVSCVCVFVAFVSAAPALAEDPKAPEPKVKVGDKAPDFALPKAPDAKEDDEAPKLSTLKGKKNLVIAFYPKVFTGGCTKQMCGYRDDFDKYESSDTDIVAVSTDAQSESDRFRTEHKLPFPVLGDPDKKVIDAYGIPVKDYDGTPIAQRAVVLVDKEGVVRYIDMDYRIDEDEKPLLDAIAAANEKADGDAKEKG